MTAIILSFRSSVCGWIVINGSGPGNGGQGGGCCWWAPRLNLADDLPVQIEMVDDRSRMIKSGFWCWPYTEDADN